MDGHFLTVLSFSNLGNLRNGEPKFDAVVGELAIPSATTPTEGVYYNSFVN